MNLTVAENMHPLRFHVESLPKHDLSALTNPSPYQTNKEGFHGSMMNHFQVVAVLQVAQLAETKLTKVDKAKIGRLIQGQGGGVAASVGEDDFFDAFNAVEGNEAATNASIGLFQEADHAVVRAVEVLARIDVVLVGRVDDEAGQGLIDEWERHGEQGGGRGNELGLILLDQLTSRAVKSVYTTMARRAEATTVNNSLPVSRGLIPDIVYRSNPSQ